jgi:hypothetical protein
MITGISGSETNAPPRQCREAPVSRVPVTPCHPHLRPPRMFLLQAASQQAVLAAQVAAQPTVRPDQVERAKQLLSSPNYPPRAIVESVAKLIADSQPE